MPQESVFTEGKGGAGDSRVYIRGFDQENSATLINGVPVNDMENGRMFWSNWDGMTISPLLYRFKRVGCY